MTSPSRLRLQAPVVAALVLLVAAGCGGSQVTLGADWASQELDQPGFQPRSIPSEVDAVDFPVRTATLTAPGVEVDLVAVAFVPELDDDIIRMAAVGSLGEPGVDSARAEEGLEFVLLQYTGVRDPDSDVTAVLRSDDKVLPIVLNSARDADALTRKVVVTTVGVDADVVVEVAADGQTSTYDLRDLEFAEPGEQ